MLFMERNIYTIGKLSALYIRNSLVEKWKQSEERRVSYANRDKNMYRMWQDIS